MITDYLIIGQGVSGTWLSYYLLKEKKSIIVLDSKDLQSASNVASGLINPVTGRRVVTTWMADELMPFVWKEYAALSEWLGLNIISQKNTLVFPSAPDLMQAFDERIKQDNSYIKPLPVTKEILYSTFNFPFEAFEISPCYVVQMRQLQHSFRQFLSEQNILIKDVFDEKLLVLQDDYIQYKNINAQKIIYADGIKSFESRYWKNLPFVQNKGQALIVEIEDLNPSYTYKFGHLTLIHLHSNVWWAGSSNELTFTATEPSEEFKKRTVASLKSILKTAFIVKEHWSALRPATVERRPFVGIHPLYKQIGILNGMGSKGCSLAPWFAKELTENLIYNKPINVLADVKRFENILKR